MILARVVAGGVGVIAAVFCVGEPMATDGGREVASRALPGAADELESVHPGVVPCVLVVLEPGLQAAHGGACGAGSGALGATRRLVPLLAAEMTALTTSPALRSAISSGFETWARALRVQR